MLRKQSNYLLAIHQILDLIIISGCFVLAFYTKINLPGPFGGLTDQYDYRILLLLALMSFHISLRLFGAYSQYRKLTLNQIIFRIFKGTITGTAGVIFLGYMIHLDAVSRLFIALFCCYIFLALTLVKITLYRVLAHSRYKDYNIRYILIVGSKQRTQDFIKAVKKRKESGYRIIGCLETVEQTKLIGTTVCDSIKIIGTMDAFKEMLRTETIDEVVFGLPLNKIVNAQEYIYYAESMGKNIKVLPDFQINKIKYFPQTANIDIEDFLGVTTLALSSTPQNTTALTCKSSVDYVGSSLGIVLLSPLFILIAISIKCSSRGPVFFTQERIGLNGRRFKLHKFRTMVVDAEQRRDKLAAVNEMDGPVFKIKKDPRITFIGSFLRRASLDELPQLFNVFKGEMSLVGPRPPIPSEVAKYQLWQRRRLSMKPGLTCIWQVSGRNNISFEKWMNMDLEYIDNWSLGLDCRLLLLTVKEVTVGGGR